MSKTRPDPLEWQEDPPPASLPPKGSTWRKTAWLDRTVVSTRFNRWGHRWHVTCTNGQGGTMEIPLTIWKKWVNGAERIDICSECGKNPADLPSRLCTGCEAYREHTAHA